MKGDTIMQIKRIKAGQWYQTKDGIGKCISVSARGVKVELDGQEVWLSSSDVQHEIAAGQEPQAETDPIPPDVAKIVAELHRLRASNAAMLEALERVERFLGSVSHRLDVGPVYQEVSEAIAKAKRTP